MYISNKTEHFSYKDGVVYMGVVHVSRCIKEKLARATDEQFLVSYIVLFKNINTTKELKNKAVLS